MHGVRWNRQVVKTIGALSRVRDKTVENRGAAMELLLDRCWQELVQAGAGEEDCRVRLFALCAFCDDVLLAPLAGDGPLRFSMVRKRFANGGADFYKIAQELADAGDVAFMVYWLVFRCGFRGRLDGSSQEAAHWEISARGRLWEIVENRPKAMAGGKSNVGF
jgi:type VI protein secretion system component VasF